MSNAHEEALLVQKSGFMMVIAEAVSTSTGFRHESRSVTCLIVRLNQEQCVLPWGQNAHSVFSQSSVNQFG